MRQLQLCCQFDGPLGKAGRETRIQGAMSDRIFYITTPIYYVNDVPHLGHAYTTILADTAARFKRFTGHRVFFLTGTDEHGNKIAQAALKAGDDTQAYANRISAVFRDTWQALKITHTHFIRTSDPSHQRLVQDLLQRIYDRGDIYLGEYGGQYCFGCERFYTERELLDGKCPDHQVEPTFIREENYFFRMSKYQERLVKHLEEYPDFVRPERYRNEVLAFLREPLEDLCISRPISRLSWGIPLPFDSNYVTYVWFDALINYLSGLGYPDSEESRVFWPEANHLIAKDIVKPHGIYWPTMLWAAEIPLFRHLHVHGYWKVEWGKMSKSLGNVVRPLDLTEKYGLDALRYFLLREMVFGLDARFSEEALISRLNSDLANDLGNLVSRVLTMIDKFLQGRIPERMSAVSAQDHQLLHHAETSPAAISRAMDELAFNRALESLWELVNAVNKYIDSTKPWELGKKDPQALERILFHVWEAVRIVGLLLAPFLPDTGQTISNQLGIDGDVEEARIEQAAWGSHSASGMIRKGPPLFPRMEGGFAAIQAQENPDPAIPQINLAEFQRLDLRVAEIVRAELVAGSKNLLKLTVRLGAEERIMVAGIQGQYAPEALIGKKVAVVANLKPARLKGIESQGMVLAAEDAEGRIVLLTPDKDIPPGSKIR